MAIWLTPTYIVLAFAFVVLALLGLFFAGVAIHLVGGGREWHRKYLDYRTLAEVGLPIVVYNVPGRTGGNVSATTLMRLAEHPMIVAVKEASGSVEQVTRCAKSNRRRCAWVRW